MPKKSHVPPHQGHGKGDHHQHHAHMVADFRRRFWVSLALTIPVLALSPMIQGFLGLGQALRFTGDLYVLFVSLPQGTL